MLILIALITLVSVTVIGLAKQQYDNFTFNARVRRRIINLRK